MNATKEINKLWNEFQQMIDDAYASGDQDTKSALSDYRSNSRHPELQNLLDRETANERQHRKFRYQRFQISAEVAAKLILLGQVKEGANKTEMPLATLFLCIRPTAAEAEVLGYLVRRQVSADWCIRLDAWDYAKLMQDRTAVSAWHRKSRSKMLRLQCAMSNDCHENVTHIGEKGWIYCTEHAINRRSSEYERTRILRAWEIALLLAGKEVPSYERVRKPVEVQP